MKPYEVHRTPSHSLLGPQYNDRGYGWRSIRHKATVIPAFQLVGHKALRKLP